MNDRVAKLRMSDGIKELVQERGERPRPSVRGLHSVAALLDTKVERESTLLLRRSEENPFNDLYDPSHPRYIEVIADTLDEEALKTAVFCSLRDRVHEARLRGRENRYVGGMALTLTGLLIGLYSSDAPFTVGGVAMGTVSAAVAWHAHHQSIPEPAVPDLSGVKSPLFLEPLQQQ